MVGYWRGCLTGASCRLAYGSADATATLCFSKIQIGFTYLVPANSVNQVVPNKGPLNAHVCVCSNGNSPARVSDLVADFEVKEGEQKSCVKTGNR